MATSARAIRALRCVVHCPPTFPHQELEYPVTSCQCRMLANSGLHNLEMPSRFTFCAPAGEFCDCLRLTEIARDHEHANCFPWSCSKIDRNLDPPHTFPEGFELF